jgi:hypothetical protein
LGRATSADPTARGVDDASDLDGSGLVRASVKATDVAVYPA